MARLGYFEPVWKPGNGEFVNFVSSYKILTKNLGKNLVRRLGKNLGKNLGSWKNSSKIL